MYSPPLRNVSKLTIALALLSSSLITPAFANDDMEVQQESAKHSRMSESTWSQMRRSSKIIGAEVRTPQGEKIGTIDDIVLNGRGRVAYAVLSSGGLWGMGDKLFAIPWQSFEYKERDGEHYVLNVKKEVLSKAPGFDKNRWPDMASPRWNADIDKYYRVKPYGKEKR